MIYNVVIYFVLWGIAIASLFNEKVRKMWRGERDAFQGTEAECGSLQKYIWFHAASLGEFEQGRSLDGAYSQGVSLSIRFCLPSIRHRAMRCARTMRGLTSSAICRWIPD